MKKQNAGLKSSLPPTDEQAPHDIVVDYVKRFPDAPAKTLARLIYRQWPNHFKHLEAAYSSVRYTLGLKGERKRQHTNGNGLQREPRKPGYIPAPQVELEWKPVILPPGETLIISDLHVPFHEPWVIELALCDAVDRGITNLVLNGDVMDCHQLSRFSKRPDLARYQHEIDMTMLIFDTIRERLPEANVYWKLGNHEERLEDYMATKATAFFGLAAMDWTNLLKLNDFNIKLVKDKNAIMAGKLAIFHGHEFPKGMTDPVNPARGFFLRTLENVIGSHHHRVSQHSESSVWEHITSAWSIGCCCNRRPRYMPVNKWQLGYAIVKHDTKEFSVDNKRCIKGKAY